MIVMNEKKLAEDIIKSGKVGTKPSATLSLLARYYRRIYKLNDNDIYFKLNQFMTKSYPKYNEFEWRDLLNKVIAHADKYPLVQIDKIPITENEIQKIRTIKSKTEEKLMFTILCFTKFYDLRNANNNHWCNTDDCHMFYAANITHSVKSQSLMIKDLWEKKFVDYSDKIDNLSLKINIIDNSSPIVIEVNDLSADVGKVYQAYVKNNK